MFLKKMTLFPQILEGEAYNWYFSLNKETSKTINKLKEEFKKNSTIFSDSISKAYNTQIRNAIAHSQYSIIGRSIHLHNKVNKNEPQLDGITFDEWTAIFHHTMGIYNQYIKLHNTINNYYSKLALENGNEIEILTSEKDGKQYTLKIEYRNYWGDWKFKS